MKKSWLKLDDGTFVAMDDDEPHFERNEELFGITNNRKI
jgi:hypothetical protein